MRVIQYKELRKKNVIIKRGTG